MCLEPKWVATTVLTLKSIQQLPIEIVQSFQQPRQTSYFGQIFYDFIQTLKFSTKG